MPTDLVRIQTRDGVFLDGLIQRPQAVSTRDAGPEAVLCVHGTGGNFYSSTLFDFLAGKLLERGVAVLRGNTRGHDVISNVSTTRGGQRLGAAYEVVDDCRHDLLAWITWLRDNVGPRLMLIGHSLGAVKCLYAAAHEPAFFGGVASPSMIALSPPRLSYEWFCSGAKHDEFLSTYRLAEERVAGKEPLALLDVKVPIPFVITAGGFLEKYGPDERYNFVKVLPGVRVPTLFLFGAMEVRDNVAFQGLPALIEERKIRSPHFDVRVIASGDHFYSGVRDAAWAAIERWQAPGAL